MSFVVLVDNILPYVQFYFLYFLFPDLFHNCSVTCFVLSNICLNNFTMFNNMACVCIIYLRFSAFIIPFTFFSSLSFVHFMFYAMLFLLHTFSGVYILVVVYCGLYKWTNHLSDNCDSTQCLIGFFLIYFKTAAGAVLIVVIPFLFFLLIFFVS